MDWMSKQRVLRTTRRSLRTRSTCSSPKPNNIWKTGRRSKPRNTLRKLLVCKNSYNFSQNYSLRRKALVDKRFQLQQAAMDKQAIEAMTQANDNMKDQEKYTQKLQDLILDGQQAKMQQQQINDKLKDLVDNEDEEEDVDDMLNELMGEIKQEKQKNVAKQSIQANVPQQQKPQQVQQKQQRDQIEDMLNAL